MAFTLPGTSDQFLNEEVDANENDWGGAHKTGTTLYLLFLGLSLYTTANQIQNKQLAKSGILCV